MPTVTERGTGGTGGRRRRPGAGRRRGPSMSQERRVDIAELAEEVSTGRMSEGPLDLRLVARQNAISLSFGAYGDAFDGMLEYRDGRFHIFANLGRLRSENSPRARFTLGHELGHSYIDEHRNALAAGRTAAHLSRCEFESSLLAEQEADHFAANLLMPGKLFREAARGLGPGFGCIRALAQRFGSSLTAAAIRYAALDISPCAVIKWHWRGYRWKYFSSSMFRRHFRQIFEVPEKLTEDCATLLALAQKQPPDCGYFQSGTLASAWFPWVRHEDILDVVLIEEAVPQGRFGALTVLYPRRDCRILRKP